MVAHMFECVRAFNGGVANNQAIEFKGQCKLGDVLFSIAINIWRDLQQQRYVFIRFCFLRLMRGGDSA